MTVSRVIGEPSLVMPATRERVLKAIADLGYVPDRTAGSLSTRRSGFIGLILPTLTNANFSMVAHGLTDALRDADYHLLIGYTDYDLAEDERQLSKLLERRPEALVLTGVARRRTATKRLHAAQFPIIEIADLPRHPIHHVIGFSNYEVGRLAARYLVGKGFQRIGAVASQSQGDVGDFRGDERMSGFEDELRLSGKRTDLVLHYGEPPVSYAHGAAAIGVLLDREPKLEAVFAVSDLSAVGVIMECQRRKVEVPGQLSVVGFGDFDIGREINPALTTIRVDFRGLGEQAGKLILDLLDKGANDAPVVVDVGLQLVERASVRT